MKMNPPPNNYTLLGGRLAMCGPALGEDALWLAASIPTLPPQTEVLDAACGIGTAALALLARQPHLKLTAVDIDPHLTARARKNAARNTLPLTVHTHDILTFKHPPFPHVLCNPPFHAEERGHTGSQSKTLPRNQLPQWLTALLALTAPKGELHLILHAAQTEELIPYAQQHNLALTLTPLQTAAAKLPKRLLAILQKTGRHALTQNPPIPTHDPTLRQRILHQAEGLE